MIKILSITYLEGTTFVGEGHQIRLAARHAERPPGRWSGLVFDGRLVLQGSHLVLLPSRVRLELIHKLKITVFFRQLSRKMGQPGIFKSFVASVSSEFIK